ncbi:hypothetical protein AQI95_40970 [Streptomyces yokosukanensis]|uniref:Uncharacterized protein n=1 Tax=Streptomyces yokosukanensis TaxID=67386 RepID=A0A101NTS5_9ACTN|nr:hypothetical protein [Streptomyces yokosukanensis]KUM99079.1 hypothetical protein AQI95_40970 [Streptomyces yokosukanensis]
MIPKYVPSFRHQDWIDNEDRVQAGGERGLNIRFHDLEAEFQTLADAYLNPVIAALFREQRILSVIPLLTANQNASQTPGWDVNVDAAVKPSGATSASGIMNVVLPDGAVIKSLTVFGTTQPSPSTALLSVNLRSRPVTAMAGATTVVTVQTFGAAAVPTTVTTVDNSVNKYFIEADLTGAQSTDVTLNCFQIVYQ